MESGAKIHRSLHRKGGAQSCAALSISLPCLAAYSLLPHVGCASHFPEPCRSIRILCASYPSSVTVRPHWIGSSRPLCPHHGDDVIRRQCYLGRYCSGHRSSASEKQDEAVRPGPAAAGADSNLLLPLAKHGPRPRRFALWRSDWSRDSLVWRNGRADRNSDASRPATSFWAERPRSSDCELDDRVSGLWRAENSSSRAMASLLPSSRKRCDGRRSHARLVPHLYRGWAVCAIAS